MASQEKKQTKNNTKWVVCIVICPTPSTRTHTHTQRFRSKHKKILGAYYLRWEETLRLVYWTQAQERDRRQQFFGFPSSVLYISSL
jgi:hypothetical protein